MGWISEFFSAREQLAFYKERCAVLEAGQKEAETKLFAEIDRNRRREEALLADRAPLPHNSLAPTQPEPVDDAPAPSKASEDYEMELIHRRAKEMYEHDRERGIDYDYDVLVNTMIERKDEYLAN